tara:strand:- start:6990 stop:7916 length:927 start_codon:yes stop_codon:yes gene_type:complete
MNTPVSTILHRELDKPKSVDILALGYDGWFEEQLQSWKHNLFLSEKGYQFTGRRPESVNYISELVVKIPNDILFGAILYNEFEMQNEKAEMLSRMYHIPKMLACHSAADESTMAPTDKNTVFLHKFVRDSYIDPVGDVINIPIPVVEADFAKKDIDILIYGHFTHADRNMIHYLTTLDFKTEVYGVNQGISEDIPLEELEKKMGRSKIYVNLSMNASLPTPTLKAMGHGCAIVSNSTPIMVDYLSAKSGSLLTDGREFGPIFNKVLDGAWEDMGHWNQELIKTEHNMEECTRAWESKVLEVAKEVYVL